jgi:hypothetical protein
MKLQRHHGERDGRRLGQTRVGSPEPAAAVGPPAEVTAGPAEVTEEPVETVAGPALVGAEPAEVGEVGEEPMKCVWSGYPDYNRDCRSRIPATVVVKAWHREIQLKGTVEGFFYFSWRHGVWLAYGVREGGVRGVYCPTHCHQRNSRETQGEEPATPAPLDVPQPSLL